MTKVKKTSREMRVLEHEEGLRLQFLKRDDHRKTIVKIIFNQSPG